MNIALVSSISWGYFIRALFLKSRFSFTRINYVDCIREAIVFEYFPFELWMDNFHTHMYTNNRNMWTRTNSHIYYSPRGYIVVCREIDRENVCTRKWGILYENDIENEKEEWIYLIRLKFFCFCFSSTPFILFITQDEHWMQTYYYSIEYPDFYLTLWMENIRWQIINKWKQQEIEMLLGTWNEQIIIQQFERHSNNKYRKTNNSSFVLRSFPIGERLVSLIHFVVKNECVCNNPLQWLTIWWIWNTFYAFEEKNLYT